MIDITAILVSSDSELIKNVRTAVRSVRNCRLAVVSQMGDVRQHLGDTRSAIVLCHMTGHHREQEALQFLRGPAASTRRAMTLIIDEQYDPARALKLFQAGAADYLSRPLDLNRLALLISVGSLRNQVLAGGSATSRPQENTFDEHEFAYSSESMVRLMDQVRAVAPTRTTVLLTGETGTGKTRLARLIHQLSPRSKEPFVGINCGAVPAALVESELFGHVKGAFTGAEQDRTGRLVHARTGTLLLDEIEALPLSSQSKLLRVVDEREFEPVGSNTVVPLEARLIVATNACLDDEIRDGRFRADLYHRLNVVAFRLPPLRERRAIVPHLARQFAVSISEREGRPCPELAPEVVEALQAYDWPGNIRELRNVIERVVALCQSPQVDLCDLPEAVWRSTPLATTTPPRALPRKTLSSCQARAELDAIVSALRNHANNRSRAARELGISRVTLYKKLHKYGLC